MIYAGNFGSLLIDFSSRFDNLSGSQTAGAYPDMDCIAALGGHSDTLQVGKPAPLVLVMGMAYVIAGHRALAAYFTFFCHDKTPYY
jgi:hypothetical protein